MNPSSVFTAEDEMFGSRPGSRPSPDAFEVEELRLFFTEIADPPAGISGA